MKYFVPFLVIIGVHYNVVTVESLKLFRSSINPMSKMTTTTTSSTQLYSLGTDMLQRPDDEDSPEFKEYLRQLMVMQANRAKLGYMAPSSSSSDVYVAKLNRIKLEKERLRELGYPDAEIDMSYKESDYKAAVYEAQEPTVSASGGLSIKPLPDSVYGLPESDEEILARSNIGGRSINKNNQKVDENNAAAVVALPSATSIPPSVVINEAPPTFTKRGGQKARSLSSEEIEATRAAEANVKAFLADKKNLYLKDAATSASSSTPTTVSAPAVNPTPVMPSIINPLLPKGATMNPQITNFLEGQIKNQNSNDPNFNLIDTLLAKSGVVIPKTPVKSALTAASNLNTVGNHKPHHTSHSSTTQTTGSKDSPSYAAAQKQALLQKQQLQLQQSKLLHPQTPAAAVVASSTPPPVQRFSAVTTQPINAVAKPVSPPPQLQQSPPHQQQPQRTVQPPAAPAVMSQTAAKKEYIQQKKQQTAEPVVPVTETTTAAVSLNGKMSQKDELMVGEAVQWIVKHRGGGPYGAGRLQSPSDVLAMETALLNTVAILKADRVNIAAAQASITPAIPLAAAVAARTVQSPAASAASVRAAPSQQQQRQVVRPTVAAVVRSPPPPQQVVKPAVVSPRPPPAHQQQSQQKTVGLGAFLESMEKKPAAPPAAFVSDSSSAGAVSMPIALGLDAFLANPQETSMEEMTALRDGLIDCLALLSNHIRAAAVDGVTASAPAAPAVSGSPATVALLSDNSKPLPLDQELKLTLGLLLKHRGGPGFGHGRLDGAELASMSTRLRSIAHTLASEAAAAAVSA